MSMIIRVAQGPKPDLEESLVQNAFEEFWDRHRHDDEMPTLQDILDDIAEGVRKERTRYDTNKVRRLVEERLKRLKPARR